MSEPRTAREALIAQMLGELDELLRRAEQLPTMIAGAEQRIAASVQVLDEAGDRYRLAVTAFTEEAKLTLTDYLQSKAAETVVLTVEEQRAALQEAVRAAIRSGSSRMTPPDINDEMPVGTGSRSRFGRRLGQSLIAVLSSVLTASLVLLITKLV